MTSKNEPAASQADDGDIRSPMAQYKVAVADDGASYNEDLAWIVRQYKERIGAAGVAVSIHYSDDRPVEFEVIDSIEGPTGAEIGGGEWLNIRHGKTAPFSDQLTASWRSPTREFPWHVLVMEMASNESSRAVISAFYHKDGLEDAPAAEFIARRFQPVLAGYFKLWLLHRSTSRRLQMIISALAHVDVGVIVLDRDARVVFENPAASRILDDGKALHRCRGSICAEGRAESLSLRIAIDDALSNRSHGGSDSPVIFIRAPKSTCPLVAAVTPVEGGGVGDRDPAAVVHLFDPATSVDRTITPVCGWYGLSDMETRLVTMLVTGRSVAEMAEREGLKQDTARTYLKNVFRKTNTKSQADLVRLMMTNPVRLRFPGRTKSIRTKNINF